MQVGFAIAAGDAVERHQGVVFRCRQAQQQISLPIVGTVKLGVAEHLVGPQAAFAAITGLAPEQQLRVLFLQGFASGRECFDGRMFRWQLVRHRRCIATGADLAIETQLPADLADRPQRVNSLDLDRRAIVDDLRIDHARHDRQILTFRHISGKQQGTETAQCQQTEGTHE
ncbi:hypothetical protein D3C87_1501090 [compost metagenome]